MIGNRARRDCNPRRATRRLLGLLVLAAGLVIGMATVQAQTLNGVTLGAPLPDDLRAPDSRNSLRGQEFLHWDLTRDMTMSVWAASDDGPVLSVQVARTGPLRQVEAPLEGVLFGVATTAQIEARFGPAGPVYEAAGQTNVFGGLTTHNLSYEIDDGAAVVTFITMEDRDQPGTVGRDRAVLDAIILADRAFQEVFWGDPSYPDSAYIPIPSPF